MGRTGRRTTLASLSSSNLNMRTSLGASGGPPARKMTTSSKKKRHSMAPKQHGGVKSSRRSLAPGALAGYRGHGGDDDDYGRDVSTPARSHTPSRSRQSLGSAMRRRRSSGMGPPPSSAKKRQSLSLNPSTSARRGGMVKNDPRPVRTKKYQNMAIHLLITYLTHHKYDDMVTPQILAQPSARQFRHMFQFLYHGFDPYYGFGDRFDAEVAQLFSFMAYPFRINKSALASVGSSHTWPAVLAGMAWMVKLLLYEQEMIMLEEEDDADIENGDKLFFDFICKCYNAFLAGEDEFEMFEYELVASFEDRNKNVIDQIEASRQAVDSMTTTIDKLTSQEPPVKALRAEEANFRGDLAKFDELIVKLEGHTELVSAKVEDAAAEEAAKAAELESLKEQKAAIELAVSQQPVSSGDVERMNKEKAALEASVDNLTNLRDEANNAAWDAELELSKATDSLASLVDQVNARLADLSGSALAGEDSFPAHLRDAVAVAFNPSGSTVDDLVTVQPAQIEIRVTELRSAFAELNHQLHGAQLQAKERKEANEERVAEKESAVAALDAQINKIERQCTAASDASARTIAQLTQETAQLEEDTLRLRTDNTAGVASTSEQLKALQNAYADMVTRCDNEKDALNECIVGTLDMLAAHKEAIQNTFDNVHHAWQSSIEEVANIAALSLH